MAITYNRHFIDQKDINTVVKVLKSNFITQGPKISEFENSIANKVNSKFAIASNSATSSLHLACMAIGLKKGDWFWTSPNSFVASSNCGILCGAKVDFVDIDPETFNMDVNLLEAKLKKAKKQKRLPKIIIPVHFGGLPCDMKKIFFLSKKYNFKIIEDASHALGAEYESQKVGSCKYSHITVFSFHPVKMITTVEGGVATTNYKKYADTMKNLRTHGIIKNKDKFLKKKEGDWYYEQINLGYNYRMSDVQAALGLSQLKKLDIFLKRRRKLANLYKEELKNLPINFQHEKKFCKSSYHLFVIEVKGKKELRKKIFNNFKKKNIFLNVHYIPIHLQPFYKKRFGFKKGQFKFAEKYYERAITLPLHYSLSISNVKMIVGLIKNNLCI